MRIPSWILGTFVILPLVAAATWTLASAQQSVASRDVQRGKYLVEEVAKCSECHTPRDQHNQLDRDRWLQGAPTWIRPVVPTPDWAEAAPILAGLTNYSDAQVEQVLEKGQGVAGKPIQPPMHIYHMNHEDAMAIIAYLRSLPRPFPAQR